MNNSILSDVYTDVISYFDSNDNNSVDYYEIYPVFLFFRNTYISHSSSTRF